jgi:hypothetical protein
MGMAMVLQMPGCWGLCLTTTVKVAGTSAGQTVPAINSQTLSSLTHLTGS